MAVISIATLKTFFETGDKPTEAQFVDLIDTLSALPTPGTTLTADQVDAIDNANSPNSGNPFATMADIVTGGNTSITPITVTSLQALQTGSTISTTTFYNVTNAVGSTRVLQVYAIANNTNIVWAVDVTTGEIGTYDITGDVFVGGSGTYTPTLTPDGVVCTSASVSGGYYSANGTIVDGSIELLVDLDFAGGTVGTISIDTLPIVAGTPYIFGSVQFGVGDGAWMTALGNKPFYSSLENNIITIFCEAGSGTPSGLLVRVNFQYEIN